MMRKSFRIRIRVQPKRFSFLRASIFGTKVDYEKLKYFYLDTCGYTPPNWKLFPPAYIRRDSLARRLARITRRV